MKNDEHKHILRVILIHNSPKQTDVLKVRIVVVLSQGSLLKERLRGDFEVDKIPFLELPAIIYTGVCSL